MKTNSFYIEDKYLDSLDKVAVTPIILFLSLAYFYPSIVTLYSKLLTSYIITVKWISIFLEFPVIILIVLNIILLLLTAEQSL